MESPDFPDKPFRLSDELEQELQQARREIHSELAAVGMSSARSQKPDEHPPVVSGRIRFPERLLQNPGAEVLPEPSGFCLMPQSGYRSVEISGLRGLSVAVEHLGWVNYAQFHAGVSFLRRICVRGGPGYRSESPLLEISLQPAEYSASFKQSIVWADQHQIWEQRDVRLPLRLDRLRQIRETERASLQISVSCQGREVLSETQNIDIQPYNQYVLLEQDKRFLATFVTPNAPSLQPLLEPISLWLKQQTQDSALSGYQSGDPSRVCLMARAIHEVLRQVLQIAYINPPPSFDLGQKVRPVSETLELKRGTCLDLSILFASLLELIGLHPLIILVPGHAFPAFWTTGSFLRHPAPDLVTDPELLRLLQAGNIIPFNSTTLCKSEGTFESAVQDGISIVNGVLESGHGGPERQFIYLIDIVSCRHAGIIPLP